MSHGNPQNHPHEGQNDLASRLTNLQVDDRFPSHQAHINPGHAHHPSPNPTGFTPSLNANNRSFAYPDPSHMDIYGFYQPALPLNGTGQHLDAPFSPHTPAMAGGFTYAPAIPGDMAGLMQNQFEYGQADPYGGTGGGGVNQGLGLGMDGVSMSLRVGEQTYRARGPQGQQRGNDQQRSPVRSAFRQSGGGGQRDGQQHQQGRKMAPDAGMMSPASAYGGYGASYWPTNNGTFVERGKKPQVETPRAPHTVLRPHSGFTQHYSPSITPLYPGGNAVRNPYGQYTPNTPSLHQLVPIHYGPQYTNPLLRFQGARPRRFDDSPRSALLEDFRLNKTDRNWGLAEIFGHIIEFSGDQHGSRLIQTKIEHASEQDRQAMYLEILPNAATLMQDVFGNYCIQKFFDHGNEEQARGLAEQMRGRVYDLSMQMYGCRVVQKALDKVDEDQKLSMIAELEGKIVECVKSANANHVIQRIIQSNPPKSVPDAFLGHAQDLSIHSFGCRVLQKAVENLPDDHKRDLLEELQGCARRLIEDAFGNYVVQSMIIAAGPAHKQRVIKLIRGQVWTFSRHKFASNVVEKAILHAEPNDKRELVYELVNFREDGTHRVHSVLRDPFANFVLQTCLKSAERSQRQQLLDLIVPLMNTIRHTPPGKRLDQIITEMQSEGFTVSVASPSLTFATPDLGLPPNPLLHANADTVDDKVDAASETATETDDVDQLDVSISVGTATDSGSSGNHRSDPMSPDCKPAPAAWDGKKLRPTASAPPRSDRPEATRMGTGVAVKVRAGSPLGLGTVKKEREDLIDLLG